MSISRHFIDWNRPVLPAAAEYLIQKYAVGDELDLSGVVAVFTGRRAARRMLEILVEQCEDRWPAFRPPKMVTFQKLPEMLYQQKRQLADDLTQLLVWKKALSSIPSRELHAALPAIPDDETVTAWLALCESLRKQHVELAADGMEFDEVFAQLSQMGNHSEADRWKALRRIQAEYLTQMDDLQLWDRQAARLVAVEMHECAAAFDVVLIGTVDMNRIVKQMLAQVADRVTALIHAPDSEADAFDDFGCLKPDAWEHRRLNIPLEATRIVDRPAEQAAAVVSELSAKDRIRRADDVVVGVANEALVPVILQGLADAGVSGRWPVGSEVGSSRPWRLLDAIAAHLATARGGLPPDFATMAELLRHPDMDPWISRHLESRRSTAFATTDWLARFDAYLADHLPMTPGVILGSRETRNVVTAICGAVDSLLANLLPMSQRPRISRNSSPAKSSATNKGRQRQLAFDDQNDAAADSLHSLLARRRPLSEWADGMLLLVAEIYGDYQYGESTHRDESITECCSALSECCDALHRIPDAVMPRCTPGQAIQLLLRQIEDVAVPPETDDEAIDLLGWLELPMDDAPELILTGFNEGFIPESITSDVFLPNSLRVRLGLIDNHRRYARDAYALTALMHSRDRITFIAGRTDSDGNPLTPSRLWFAVEPQDLPKRVRWFYGNDNAETPLNEAAAVDDKSQAPNPNPRRDVPATDETTPRRSGFAVPEPPVIPPPPKQIAVTAFRDYLDCPYRYFLRHELHLKSVDDETRELSAAAFGSLIHDVLSAFGKSQFVHGATAESIEQFLLDELRRLARRKFGRNRSATIAVQLEMAEDRLRKFAACQATMAAEGWNIQGTELDLVYPDFTDSRGRKVSLKGRVDRIDRHSKTGRWRVLDYKTSENARKPEATHRSKGEWVDLQLPLYRLLVRSHDVDGEIELGYIHLPGDLSAVGLSIADWSAEDLAAAYDVASAVAADIVDLKIDRVEFGRDQTATQYSRVCQETVIDRSIPWLTNWSGRRPGAADV
ncbi:MAG: PD-(D/E)XK nuclease family protein [Planctomycetaceae bacterium]